MSGANASANANETRVHCFPGTVAEQRPSAWWYWGRAVYVSRRDYWRITKYFLAVGIPLGVIGVLFHLALAFWAAMALAEIGLVLAYSLFGLYRMYGHPGVAYVRRLVELGRLKGPVTVADLHIGTYRHAFLLSDVLPEAKIQSVDCWNVEGESPEEAVQDVCDLGTGMASVFLWNTPEKLRLDADDESLKQQAAAIVEQNFPECRGKVLFVHLIRWKIGIAQFPPGRLREMTALRKRFATWNSPFDLCGDYLDGLSSEGALKTGEEAAERTARKLKTR